MRIFCVEHPAQSGSTARLLTRVQRQVPGEGLLSAEHLAADGTGEELLVQPPLGDPVSRLPVIFLSVCRAETDDAMFSSLPLTQTAAEPLQVRWRLTAINKSGVIQVYYLLIRKWRHFVKWLCLFFLMFFFTVYLGQPCTSEKTQKNTVFFLQLDSCIENKDKHIC